MKKRLFFLLVMSVLLLCGCAKKDEAATTIKEETAAIANPWVDCDAKEIADKCGFEMKAPEGAENIIYRMNESEGLCEMLFSYGERSLDYTFRLQKKETFEDISGMYYEWLVEDEAPIGNCEGKVMRAKDSGETIDVCLWFDNDTKTMCSLSTSAEDLDGFDITAIAMQMDMP